MDVQERIDNLRVQKGWSLCKLAKEAGLAETTVYAWYNKKKFTPSRKAIEAVCIALGITLTEFYSEVDDKEMNPKQTLLIQLFSQLSEKQQDNIIEFIKNML